MTVETIERILTRIFVRIFMDIFRRPAGLAACAIALTAVSACSVAFVEAPPLDHASRHFFDCTTSMLAPGLDAVLTGTLALSVLGAASDSSHDTAGVVETSALVVGALASATYGYLQVSKCRQAKDALAERLLDMPYLGVPPPDASRAARSPAAIAPAPVARREPGDRADAPVRPDPWLSEGPPPPPTQGRGVPTLMPPPPPYLRLAPQTVPPVTAPPESASAPPVVPPSAAPPPPPEPPPPAPSLAPPTPANPGSPP